MSRKQKLRPEEPVMSDVTILVSVEDLINLAMGPAEANTVNYKMLQTILHILARQLRLLETKVDIRLGDLPSKKKKKKDESSDSPTVTTTDIKVLEDKEQKMKRKKEKEKAKLEKMTPAEKEKYLKEQQEEENKMAGMTPQEKERYLQTKDDEEKKAKQKKKEEQLINTMTPEEKKMYLKQKEIDDAIMKDMSPKEKEKYLKQKERELKEFEGMSIKERERYFKETQKEQEALLKMSPQDKEKHLKEKEAKIKEAKKGKEKRIESSDEDDEEAISNKSPKEKSTKEKSSKYKEADEEEDKSSFKKSAKGKDRYSKENEDEDEDDASPTGTEKGKKSPQEKYKSAKDKEGFEEDGSSAAKRKKSPKGKDKSFKEEDEDDDSPEAKEKGRRSAEEKDKLSKDKQVLSKMTPADKEKEILARLSPKEREALEKSSPKEREKLLKEKIQEGEAMERMDRMSPEEEKEALAKMKPKEREKYLKDKEKKAKSTSSGTSIAISEVERQKEKVLVVEKGPTTRAQSRTSIEVVTISQFNILVGEVEQLKKTAGPLPMPAMPDNKKLMTDIAKGSASLTDTMQAMQVSARVQAAEEGLARMAGLLTQLAASGALPDAFAGQIEQARAEMEMLRGGLKGEKVPPRTTKSDASSLPAKGKSVAIDSAAIEAGSVKAGRATDESASVTTTGTSGTSGTAGTAGIAGTAGAGAERISRISQISAGSRRIPVTRVEMNDAIQALREDLVKSVGQLTKGAASTADNAAGTAKGIADKIEVAMKLNSRITDLFALTSDYAEQLSGFDSGLNTQMASFQEQIAQMKGDLKVGLATLDTANNNAETAAVLELTERYLGLAHELERSATEHQHLTSFQRQLAEELRGLVSAVEMLREQKADRDEVWDGLRDKADMSKLAGLVTEQSFAETRAELDDRLELCYEKFSKQESVWLQALKDLTETADTKATIMQLLSVKSETQDQLNAAHEKLKLLELQLGEPKAAILTRLLSKDGTCGACKVPALQEGVDKTAGMPCPMPYFRTPPPDELCVPAIPPVVVEDETIKSHACKRWVGGSHTLVSRTVPREVATQLPGAELPLKRYTGQGTDGRVYNLTTELKPCTECNRYRTGAGDAETTCQCWPGVTDPALEVENIEAHFY